MVDDEDDDLQRAIRLSRGDDLATELRDAPIHGERDERERSVRATAPPPSPDRVTGSSMTVDAGQDDGEAINALFGPSTKEEDGATAMLSLRGGVSGSPSCF
jgi:hypothetical protein